MPNDADAKKLAAKIIKWQREPWIFAKEVLGVEEIDPGQMDILRAYADPANERIAVKASTGTGKTFIESVICCHAISCYGEDRNPFKGIVTSIDGQNMEMNLWAEISRLYNGSEYMKHFFGLHTGKLFLKKYPMTWFIERRTWDAKASSSPHQDALGLAGHHAKYSLFLVDESSGVPKGVVTAGERTLSNKEPGGFRKLIQMGNPTHNTGPLFDAFHDEKKMWMGFTMTGDPDDPNRSRRADEVWARNLIEAYGRDYPYVQVYVLGEFPSQDFTSFMGHDEVEEAMTRDHGLEVYGSVAGRLGIDVSYGGGDRTFMTSRQGLKIFEVEEIKVPLTSPTMGFDMATIAIAKKKLLDFEDIFVDATGGYGYALMEGARMQGHQCIGVKFNQKSTEEAFANARTQMYWNCSRWIKAGGALPYDPELKKQLCATSYTIHKDKMVAEPKDIVKKKLNNMSPDKADSVVTTFFTPDRVSKKVATQEGYALGEMQGFGDENPAADFFKRPNKPVNQMKGFGGGYGRQ